MKSDAHPPVVHPPVHLRDGAGHLNPQYAAGLEARSEATAGAAEPVAILARDLRDDPLAEELGEAFVRTAGGGEEEEETLNAVVPEETGGPFVVTTGKQEFAEGTDASNPEGAERAPFPET